MSRHTAEIFLWGSRIGIVTQDESELCASFEYDRDFIGSGIELSPLMMPLSTRVYRFPQLAGIDAFRGLPGLLADSLPDTFGNAVIDEWLSRQGREPSSFTAIERLCYTGSRGMGALEYRPSTGPQASSQEKIDVMFLSRLADDVLASRARLQASNDDADLAALLEFGTSAGGARAKVVLGWNEVTGEFRSGQLDLPAGFTQWIVKLAGVTRNRDKEDADRSDYQLVEYAYYLMACAAGITMNECRLYKTGEFSHFMTKRFDRDTQTGKKIHMQSLAGLCHWNFNMPGVHSYEEAGMICRRLRLRQDSMQELFRRMVFNVMARNQDDHVKNVSFLMDRRGVWSLSPAYDLTFAYNPYGRWTGVHQMSINGKRDDITCVDLTTAAESMQLTKRQAQAIMSQVRDAVEHWFDFADLAGLDEKRARQINETFPQI